MKLSRVRQIIREELEVVLTNEEAGELFGEEVQRKLEEGEAAEEQGGFFSDSAEEEAAEGEQTMPGAIESLEESEAATDAMVNCLERIINPEGDNDIFSTLSAQTIEELETIYDILISGRIQLEAEESKLPRVAPKDIERLRRAHTADYKRHQAARKKMSK